MQSIVLWLSYILIFTIPWENAISFIGFGTFTRVIGFVLLGVWIFVVLMKGKLRKLAPFHLVLFLFILFNIFSILWTDNVAETKQRIITYLQLFTFALILWDLYSIPRIFFTGLQAYVFGAYITIGSTIINYLNGKIISSYELGRYAGASLNANDLALILTLGMPVAWHLAISSTEFRTMRILKFINYAYIPAALFAIILTSSRTSLFALIPVFIYIFATMGRIKTGLRLILVIGFVSSIFLIQNYIPLATIERLTTIGTSIANLDLGGRVVIWSRALELFFEYPIIGVGAGASRSIIGVVPHNTILSVLVELGIIGCIFFILILANVLYHAIYQQKNYSYLWITIFFIWLIGTSTLTWEFYKPTWLFMSFIIISARLFSRNTNVYT